MNIEKIDAPSANITLPLNHSVQQANGAQFALMLSLMMESLPGAGASVAAAEAPGYAPVLHQPDKDFNLETSQTRALQFNQIHHFHLLHSLYEERVITGDAALQQRGRGNANIADEMLQGVAQSRSVNPIMGREAEKVSFAT